MLRFILYRETLVRFDLLPLRLHFEAHDTLHFPDGKAANVLRGAFGLALERLGAADFFAPRSGGGPSGLADPPRPFVFRCRHLDGATIAAGTSFHFHLNLFAIEARDLVARSFAEAALEGLGPGRGRAELRDDEGDPVSLELAPRLDGELSRARVEFLTPTELKHDGRPVEQPEFAVVFARIRDRVSSLRALYGAGPLDIDFAGMGGRAAEVRMTSCDLRPVEAERRSTRTGQRHPIGGFVGTAVYEGALGEFLPFLEAARWTGVGRQAVWGKGEISVVAA
jgi:hypothetical protein